MVEHAADLLDQAAALYQRVKVELLLQTGGSRDWLHVLAALGIQLAAAQMFARRLGSVWPLLAVVAASAVSTWLDWTRWEGVPLFYLAVDKARDLTSSLGPCLVVCALARWRPDALVGRPPRAATACAKPSASRRLAPCDARAVIADALSRGPKAVASIPSWDRWYRWRTHRLQPKTLAVAAAGMSGSWNLEIKFFARPRAVSRAYNSPDLSLFCAAAHC